MNLPDFLHRDAHGELTIRGTRVGLHHFLFDYNQGESAESLAVQFPHVSLATVHKTIAFYLENRSELDDYLNRYAADMAEQRATGATVNLRALRERLIPQGASVTSD
jgi:uncharacterized protein (DUF433 family)